MTIYNFGSLNIDHVYRIDHSASPGETVVCDDFSMYAGGKGANQSIAIARAGGAVFVMLEKLVMMVFGWLKI